MAKYKLEYIRLDSSVPELRSKTSLKEFDSKPSLDNLPMRIRETVNSVREAVTA
jgi:glutamine synthetase